MINRTHFIFIKILQIIIIAVTCMLIIFDYAGAEPLESWRIKEGPLLNGDYYRLYDMSTGSNGPVSKTFDMNFNKIDKFFYYDYYNSVNPCTCGTPSYPEKQYQELRISDKATYIYDRMDLGRGTLHHTDYVDVGNRGWGIEPAEFESYVPRGNCTVCGQFIERWTAIGVVYLVDCRGTAKMPSSYSAQAGGSITILPNYNEYVTSVRWGIKFKKDETFTPLLDGTLSNGITVTGSQTRQLTLSNLPEGISSIYVGAYPYDKDGQLPENAVFPDTNFVTGISVSGKINAQGSASSTPPSSSTEKPSSSSENPSGGEIQVPGAGNSSSSSSSSKPSGSGGAGSGSNPGSSTSGGGGSGSGGGGGSSAGGGSGGGGNSGGGSSGGGSSSSSERKPLDDYKDNSKKDEYITEKEIQTPPGKKPASGGAGSSSSRSQGSSDIKTGNPKLISQAEKNKLFEQIRNNSHEYITSNETSHRNMKEHSAGNENGEYKLSSLENDAERYKDGEIDNYDDFSPDVKKKGVVFYIILTLIVLLLLAILLFVLFFGVIVMAPKENELTKLNEDFNIKVPVGLRLVTLSDMEWAVNFGDLLSKYDVLDVYLGILFAYVYEGEDIKIMTRFKGEKRKQIATEKIKRQFSVGSKRGMR